MSNDESIFDNIFSDDDDDMIKAAQDWLQLMEQAHANRSLSTKKKKIYIHRDRETAAERLHADYFAEDPRWGASVFRRRFRMRKSLFLHIAQVLEAREEYFKQRPDALGRMGFSPLIKCTVALRQLANGGAADQYDEYLHVAESTGLQCLKEFCRAVIEAFGNEYLRKPTSEDCRKLLKLHEEKHGFPGMLGSIDCMHWPWKNCPTAWRGSFTRGDKGHPTIMLEAVASQNLWIWHSFFGVAGSNNDINVLNQSPVFNDVLQGKAPAINFMANGKQYKMGYYLADGAYPEWQTFVKSIPTPTDEKRARFKTMHEAARKDVERAFGVLQARWAIIKGPSRLWYREHIHDIMYACIILHNMIIEDEGEEALTWSDEGEASTSNPNANVAIGINAQFREYLRRGEILRDKRQHHLLQADLIEEIWVRFGSLG